MKKCIMIILTIALALSTVPAATSRSDAAVQFKDVPVGSWYYSHVEFIVNYPNELMVGYAGNFGSLDNLTVEQFIKICIAATGWKAVIPQGQYWSVQYIQKGLDTGIVLPGEFTDYKRPITRAEMARIMIRVLPSITGESSVTYNLNDIKSRMVDYDSIPNDLRDYVCKAYQLGILSGGTDKRFNPNGYLTRASAASVIHLMLDPGARSPKPEAIWSDAEFEKYIKDHAKDYYCIAKIENRKIYWRNAVVTTPRLLPEEYNPGVNDLIYNCAKTLAYYANKNGNIFSPGYDEMDEGSVGLDYIIHITNVPGYSDIGIRFFAKPQMNYYASIYAPGEQKDPSYYRWQLGSLYDNEYIENQGYKPGMDRKKVDWTQEKYEKVFLHVCSVVYGPIQGKVFYDFALQRSIYIAKSNYDIDDKYIGALPNANIDVAYYFKVPEAMKKMYWTTKPEDWK
jgi:hypothetical protein